MNHIQLGEPIPNTKLIKRWQDNREISPIYQPEKGETDVLDNAIKEAESVGYTVVTIGQSAYVKMGEKWYVWSIPQGRE
jgi:hypothetical protein